MSPICSSRALGRLAGGIALCLSAVVGTGLHTATAGPPETVSGKVFLDANRDGKLDAGEKGIEGVRLTDGVNFVITASDGSYALKVTPYSVRIDSNEIPAHLQALTVGVCWPSGKWPTGKWWARMSEVSDARNVNFGLRDDEQKLPFLYLHHSDSHGAFPNGCDDFAAFANDLGSDLKFIFDTGDSSLGLTPAEKKFHVPFFHTIGNHDMSPEESPDLYGYGAWTKSIEPIRWSFDYAGIRFAGLDVIEGNACGADWIEKDLRSVPKGGRVILFWHYPNPETPPKFLKMLQDYKVEMSHAGHNHAYVNWDWVIPLYTAFNFRPPGNSNLGVVHKDGTDVAFTCIGCKSSYTHSRRCPLGWIDHILLANIRKLFGSLHNVDAKTVGGELAAIPVTEPRALVQARIMPGTAKKVGLRIGPAGKPVEIAFTGDHLVVAGVSMPLKSRVADGTLDLTVFVQRNLLSIWAQDYFFWEKSVQLDKASQVLLFADGGQAAVKSFSVQEVKADPPGTAGGYGCSCAHGSLRRTD